MPSKALKKFSTKMLVDVERLIESHGTLSHGGKGKHGLGHITRSGIFLLCASWELYIEEVAIEIAGVLSSRATSPHKLPLGAQKELSRMVSNHKNDLKPLELAGAGWEQVYNNHVIEEVRRLNTPKSGPIDEIYKKTIGWEDPSKNWSCGTDFINGFVKIRGDIAHKGSEADYVKIAELRDKYNAGIIKTAIEHDNAACDFVKNNSEGDRPWRRKNID
ncbi:MAG: HEPN domain-containing protein [Cohaesibacter sp.]|nr:HEPN domain-containing protein [Cohaesibacter sp.]